MIERQSEKGEEKEEEKEGNETIEKKKEITTSRFLYVCNYKNAHETDAVVELLKTRKLPLLFLLLLFLVV